MVGMAIWNWHGVDMLVVALVGTSDNDKKKKEKENKYMITIKIPINEK